MKNYYNTVKHFFLKEAVLCISALAAVITMFFVPPGMNYLAYIDFRVLTLLFCLMAVVAGYNKTGVFLLLSEKILLRTANVRSLGLVLILMCFFSSMWITNDVALITFVPFAIQILAMTGQARHMIPIVVLQTIAANLGSMLTPIGNPQNLYLFSQYNLGIADFFLLTLPYALLSLLLLWAAAGCLPKEPIRFALSAVQKTDKHNLRTIAMYSGLFLVCLACVLHLADYRFTLLTVLLVILLFDREKTFREPFLFLMKKVDYSLLLTFVCFFLFVGNIGNIPVIRDGLAALLTGRELPVSVLASQIISNVPAAVLLSSFTPNYKAMILGTNLGGLGTLVASLASLISYRFYARTEQAQPGKYLRLFTLYNLGFLLLLCLFYYVMNIGHVHDLIAPFA